MYPVDVQIKMYSCSGTESGEWHSYYDIEISIIERAYNEQRLEVMLDDYHINFTESIQISNTDQSSQRPVKRVVSKERETSSGLREQRFMSNPLHASAPFQNTPLFFIDEFEKQFNLLELFDQFDHSTIRQMLVEKAAEGLIVEGKIYCKENEAKKMAEELLQVKNGTWAEVAGCCARLYCGESFLYGKLNECMRFTGDEYYANLWKQKTRTSGPFAWLLDGLTNPKTDQKMTVYRGTNLPDHCIEQFRQTVDRFPPLMINFPAFTSTSRNREVASCRDGNVLFIIDINDDDARDMAPYAVFDEEEMLLMPRCAFTTDSCYLDESTYEWIIHLISVRA